MSIASQQRRVAAKCAKVLATFRASLEGQPEPEPEPEPERWP